MASLPSWVPPGEAPDLLEGTYMHELTERIERLPDGRFRRTTNIVRVGPTGNDQVATISDEELDNLFRSMYTTRENTVFARLPIYGWERTVTKHLQMKNNHEDTQVLSEASQPGLLPAPAQVNSSEEAHDAVPSVGLSAPTASPNTTGLQENCSTSHSSVQGSGLSISHIFRSPNGVYAMRGSSSAEAPFAVLPAASSDTTHQPARQSENQTHPHPLFAAQVHHRPSFTSVSSSSGSSKPLSTTPDVTGTSMHPFKPLSLDEECPKERLQTITAQECYKEYSVEELRVADYKNGRHYASMSFSSGIFGGSFWSSGSTSFGTPGKNSSSASKSGNDSVTTRASSTNVKYAIDGNISSDSGKKGDASRSSSTTPKHSINGNTSLSSQEKLKLQAGGSGPRKFATATKRNTSALRSQSVQNEAENIFPPVQSCPKPFQPTQPIDLSHNPFLPVHSNCKSMPATSIGKTNIKARSSPSRIIVTSIAD